MFGPLKVGPSLPADQSSSPSRNPFTHLRCRQASARSICGPCHGRETPLPPDAYPSKTVTFQERLRHPARAERRCSSGLTPSAIPKGSIRWRHLLRRSSFITAARHRTVQRTKVTITSPNEDVKRKMGESDSQCRDHRHVRFRGEWAHHMPGPSWLHASVAACLPHDIISRPSIMDTSVCEMPQRHTRG